MNTRSTVDRLHQMRADHLEQALRDIATRHRHPSGDAATLYIALRALGEDETAA